MKKGIIVIMMLFMVFAISAPAKATLMLDSWRLDLRGIDGLANIAKYNIQDVKEIEFKGIAHAITFDTNANLSPDIGELGMTDGFLRSTDLESSGGLSVGAASGLNTDYEMTFDFSMDAIGVDFLTTGKTFSHLASSMPGTSTDGLFEIYIDNLGDANNLVSNTVTGDGFRDGVLIAQFDVLSGDGGVFTKATYDGSDDASFALKWALPNVLFDENGIDLSTYDGSGPLVLLAISDSNYDGDDANVGRFSNPEPTNWANYFAHTEGGDDLVAPFDGLADNSTAIAFYAEEDGSAQLAVIPEPATMLLLGSGLIGLGVFGRRKKKI